MDETKDISDADFWKIAGDQYIKQEQFEKAIECYREAVNIDPDYKAAWNNLGFSYAKLGRLDEAKKCKEMIKTLQDKADRLNLKVETPTSKIQDQQPSAKQITPGVSKKPESESFLRKIPGFRSRTGWKMVLAVFGYGIIILFIIGMIASINSPSPSAEPEPSLSIDEIKNHAQSVSYDDLFRYNERYMGDIVYYRGEIVQSQNSWGDTYVLRVATKKSDYFNSYIGDIIWVDYTGTRLLESDIIDVWGRVQGLKSYEAILGNEVTIPQIKALHVEYVGKAEL